MNVAQHPRHETRSAAAITALTVLALVWIGLALGVSFLATPAKFLAPSLTPPVALDVGRHTFAWLSRIEIALAVAIFLSAIAAPRKRFPAALAGLLAAVVAAQAFWLLPVLDARVEIILEGGTPPPSALHDLYIVLEVVKLAILVAIATLALRMRRALTGKGLT